MLAALLPALAPICRPCSRRTGSSSSSRAPGSEPELPLPLRTSRRYGSARADALRGAARERAIAAVTAICPGSYDPVTNGHLDIIRRAAAIFDRRRRRRRARAAAQVAACSRSRSGSSSSQDALAGADNVEVEVFSELVVDFARRWGAKTMVKGLRAISDFEWEFQMHHLNRTLAPDIETMYLIANSAVQLRLVERREGDRRLRRERGRPRAGAGRAAVRRSCSPAEAGRPASPRKSRLDGHGRSRSHRQARRPRAQREGRPAHDQVRIDREEIYDILDQMRATIPEEIKQARWIVKERQEMLAEAKREGDRILGEAREQAVREASQTEIVKLAERQAQDIVEDARRQARETRLEMEDWADQILSTLETNLDKFLGAVRRGRERLHERSQESVMAGVHATRACT